jgi:HD-GYP domain-containing protein (c-di-GMP phosphodiesterase class II)
VPRVRSVTKRTMATLLSKVPGSDEQLQAVFRAFPDLLFVLDSDGTILDYKTGDPSLLYVSPQEFLDRKMQDSLPAEIGIRIDKAIEETHRNEKNVSVDYCLPFEGGERWFQARMVSLPNRQIAMFVRDITGYKQAELNIRRQLDRMAALRSIDLAIASSLDLNLTLTMFLSQVKVQLDIDAAAILLLNPETQFLEFSAGLGFQSPSYQQMSVRMGEGYAGEAALRREIIHKENLYKHTTDFLRYPSFAREAFVEYYAVPLVAKGRVLGVLEIFHRSPIKTDPDWLDFMEMLGGQAAIAIDSAILFNSVERSNAELTLAYDATIEGWSRALDLRDKETEGHTQRVTELTVRLARQMGMDEPSIVHIRRGAVLHDIGKMSIPDQILFKAGPLDESEWQVMRQHPVIAAHLLAPIPYLSPALSIPHYHHEKWDGTGYPFGLKGEQIPLPARLFAIIDVYDALMSDRPYRKAWSRHDTLAYIRDQSGKHFDPRVSEVFFSMIAQEK